MKLLFGTLVLAASLAGVIVPAHAAGVAKTREQRIQLTVTNKGFQPATVKVRAGQPVLLVVTRRTERTCATEIVLKDYAIRRTLPMNQAVEIRFTPRKAGTVRYACAMDMIAGQLVVE